jgi:hypothetical protein
MAIAATGPAAIIKYDDLRDKLNDILLEDMPQKHEITSALKHLNNISKEIAKELGNDAGIDWDEDERKVDISDPYLRFYLRWHVRPVSVTQGGTLVQRVIRTFRLGSQEIRTIERFTTHDEFIEPKK